ncbi:hypothetical protein Tco_1515347 [Tanacetum coccineum]
MESDRSNKGVSVEEAFKEHSKTIVDSKNDSTLSDDHYPYCEDIDYVNASSPDVEIVSLEVVESVILKVGGIGTDILLTIKDDILREKLLNVNLLISNIEALKDNPVPFSDIMTKSSSTSFNLFLEETNTFDNSLIESKTFRFNLEEISSGSTTTRSDYSLPDYEVFYLNDDHIEEKSSGSTTTHYSFFLIYSSSLIFRSICFLLPIGVIFIMKNSPMNSLTSYLHRTCGFTFVIQTFLPYLTYPVDSPLLLSTGSEDTIFVWGESIDLIMPATVRILKKWTKIKTKPSTGSERARENESNGALGFYWASP